MPQVDGCHVAGRGAARDEPSAGRERPNAAIPGRLSDVLDHDVGTAAIGEPPDVFRKVGRVVIEHVFGAERVRALRFRWCARREYTRAELARELDRRLADAAPAGEHEDD